MSQPSNTVVPASSAPAAEAGGEGGESVKREGFDNKVEFFLSCVGFAVGLGNVWRFPYLCYNNGGGAFLIPYLLMLGFVGIPLFYLEMSFGQFSSLGPITIWRINPLWKGVGWGMVIVAWMITVYYNVIVAWCMYYFFASMTDKLPWVGCDNEWNTPRCFDHTTMNRSDYINQSTATPSEEYFYNKVLRLRPDLDSMGDVNWQLAVLLFLAWVIIFLVLLKGMQTVGKAAYFVSIFPYVLLTIMLGRGASLPGAGKGVEFYMKPDWARLADANVWSDAATQIFYSLGCCMGCLIALASCNPFKNNNLRDSLTLPFINCGTSIYAGFVIFSMLGYMSESQGVPISEVARDGPGLVFVVYPEGLATMPVAPLWATLFFFMMVTLGFSSQFSQAEGCIAAVMDEFPVLRKGNGPTYCRGVFCLTAFLLGLPMVTEGGFYFFNMLNDFSAGYTLLIIGILELVAISAVYGFRKFAVDIELMLGKKPSMFWIVMWTGITPAIILFVVIWKAVNQKPMQVDGYVFPPWAQALCWMIVAWPFVTLLVWMIVYTCYKGALDVCRQVSQPLPGWGPALQENRTGPYAEEGTGGLELKAQEPLIGPNEPPPAYDNKAYVVDKKDEAATTSAI